MEAKNSRSPKKVVPEVFQRDLSKMHRFPPAAHWHHRYQQYSRTGRAVLLFALSMMLAYQILDILLLTVGRHTSAFRTGLLILMAVTFVVWLPSFIVVYTRLRVSRTKATKADLALVEDPQESVWVVEIAIRSGATTIGRDRGVLGFHGDSLFFNGRCCSFRFSAQDLSGERPDLLRRDIHPFAPTRELGYLSGLGPRVLTIRLLKHSAWNPKEQRRAFDQQLQEFIASPPTAEDRSLPPSEAPSKELPEWRA